jgi:hypothetical protein
MPLLILIAIKIKIKQQQIIFRFRKEIYWNQMSKLLLLQNCFRLLVPFYLYCKLKPDRMIRKINRNKELSIWEALIPVAALIVMLG